MKKVIDCIRRQALWPVLIFFCTTTGCLSVMEKTGRVVDGSAFAEKKIVRYRSAGQEGVEVTEVKNKAGGRSIIINLDDFPMMKLRGTYPDENGEFDLVSLEYLGGSIHGWNEYTLDLSGTGVFTRADQTAIEINEEVEPVQISSGRVHRYDTRIVGDDALTALRNRRERVTAAASWMRSREGAPTFKKIDSFEEYWKPILFPEMVSKKKRPADWLQSTDQYVKAEDIKWNTGYSERVFPEHLLLVRNSGTLLRDWEDALSWLYLEYEWENIIKLLCGQIILRQIK